MGEVVKPGVSDAEPPDGQAKASFGALIKTFSKIGALSFGGPAGQIALMHRVLVEEKRWIGERRYLTALNFCMLLPGPEATQLATYVGWRMHGVRGGLAAGLLFVLPGAAVMFVLSMLYAAYGKTPLAEELFVGIKAAVLAIVVEALLRVGRRALSGQAEWLVAGAAFLGIFALGVPFPVIVLAAALFGYFRGIGATETDTASAVAPVPLRQTLVTVAIWLAVWLAPLFAIVAIFGADHVLAHIALFFSKLAVVTFGGAYAVLAYMAQEVVQTYGWLSPGEMLDGLGLAETTPGPLILVTEFVGSLAAYRFGGGVPLLMGLLGAAVVLWATFVPCFLWIFAGAPYIERLSQEPRLNSALRSVTAAVVGVILNLTVWFALHVLFAKLHTVEAGPLTVLVPELASVNVIATVLAAVAAVLVFALRSSVLTTLAVCGALALAWARLG